MYGTIVNTPQLRCGSSNVRCLRSRLARVCEYKLVLLSCCIGQSMNGCIRPIRDRPPQVSISNLSICHCLNGKQRFGSPSCGSPRTDGKARTMRSNYKVEYPFDDFDGTQFRRITLAVAHSSATFR